MSARVGASVKQSTGDGEVTADDVLAIAEELIANGYVLDDFALELRPWQVRLICEDLIVIEEAYFTPEKIMEIMSGREHFHLYGVKIQSVLPEAVSV